MHLKLMFKRPFIIHQTHLPRAITSPLKEPLIQMNVRAHSKHAHMYRGIFITGYARIMMSAQITGKQMRFRKAWN